MNTNYNYQILKSLIAQSRVRRAINEQQGNLYQYEKETQHLEYLQERYNELLVRLNNK